MALSSLFYLSTSLYKFMLTYSALSHQYEVGVTDEEVAALDERDLPIYTILIPLYREARSSRGSWPASTGSTTRRRSSTSAAAARRTTTRRSPRSRRCDLPPHFKIVVVPDAQPKTKPKACNYGLLQARGEYVVIFDAEDRPEPDQLKKIVVAFRKGDPNVVCIQAKLNYFNRDQNLLTRWFTTEYSSWFDLLLPGPGRARRADPARRHLEPLPDRPDRPRRLGPVQRHRGRRPRASACTRRGYRTAMHRLDDATRRPTPSSTTGSASARAGSRATSRPGSCTCATRSG